MNLVHAVKISQFIFQVRGDSNEVLLIWISYSVLVTIKNDIVMGVYISSKLGTLHK